MHDTGDLSITDLAELFSVSRQTVYRTLARQVSDSIAKAMCHRVTDHASRHGDA